jgi:putative ABC transport system substrate-binding protein
MFAAPLGAEAQPAVRVRRVGILVSANPRVYDPFVDELRRRGYVDGQTLGLEFRNAEGKLDRLPSLAAELVRAGVDVILAAGTEASLRAARQATTRIPIVIVCIEYDPVAKRYVDSLARPGGNVTGVVLQQLEVRAKRMELLKAMLPKLTRLAVLWDASAADQRTAAQSAARSLGMSVQSLEIRNPSDDFSAAFVQAANVRTEALLVAVTAVFFRERAQIAQLALNHHVPTVFAVREFVEAGGLMSYGANLSEMFRRAAIYVDKILKGAKPSDLPIEQPRRSSWSST